MFLEIKPVNVVILHGWGHSSDHWEMVAEKLQKSAIIKKIFVPDLPGFGNDRKDISSYTMEEYAEKVSSMIEKHFSKKEPIVLVGHSFGGKIASLIALKNPNWICGIVLISSPLIWRPKFSILAKIFLHKIKKMARFSTKNFGSMGWKQTLNTHKKLFSESASFDITFRIKKLKNIAVCIIWGSEDQTTPISIGRKMYRMIPKIKEREEFCFVPNPQFVELIAEHNIHLDYAGVSVLSSSIIDFIEKFKMHNMRAHRLRFI